MARLVVFAALVGGFVLSGPAAAQEADFHLTYHVERTPSGQLSIDACGAAVVAAAESAGLTAGTQSVAGKLVTVSGGQAGEGAFTVQCIAVEGMTVSVVQGIDYRSDKGALGDFADQAYEAITDAIE